METKDAILTLRKDLGLSQDAFAQKLFVTRQAVSRWETGETVPSTDILKQIAKTFQVSADQLLGYPAGVCQSCGMPLDQEELHGTEADGSKSASFCTYCYQHGAYTYPTTLEGMVENNLKYLQELQQGFLGLLLAELEAGVLVTNLKVFHVVFHQTHQGCGVGVGPQYVKKGAEGV